MKLNLTKFITAAIVLIAINTSTLNAQSAGTDDAILQGFYWNTHPGDFSSDQGLWWDTIARSRRILPGEVSKRYGHLRPIRVLQVHLIWAMAYMIIMILVLFFRKVRCVPVTETPASSSMPLMYSSAEFEGDGRPGPQSSRWSRRNTTRGM
jgi:hypothetical protein